MADSNWHDLALAVYREGKVELESVKDNSDSELKYWADELEEALLDLKQATIAEEQIRATDHIEEVIAIVFELRRRK